MSSVLVHVQGRMSQGTYATLRDCRAVLGVSEEAD